MWVLQTKKNRIETRYLIQLNSNETDVSNLYKFTTVLSLKFTQMTFFLPKNFQAKV